MCSSGVTLGVYWGYIGVTLEYIEVILGLGVLLGLYFRGLMFLGFKALLYQGLVF